MPIHLFQHSLNSFNRIQSRYNLDISGLAGFFGGNVSVTTMGTVLIFRWRKWLGWYNSPGSFEIAKGLSTICSSRLWEGIYGPTEDEAGDPTSLFGLDGKDGPAFYGLHSGITMPKTGHLANLLADECAEAAIPKGNETSGRISAPQTVTIMNLARPSESTKPGHRKLSSSLSPFIALLPIAVTVVTCVMSILVADDWFACSLIMYGALAHGLSCFIIGHGANLTVRTPKSPKGVPRGDGVLGGDTSNLVVLLGEESAVSAITRGAFELSFSESKSPRRIWVCVFLLTAQFLVQLLVIPLGTPFGQLMFLASLFATWIYTAYLSSINRKTWKQTLIHQAILHNPVKDKYRFGSRTATAAFTILVLRARFYSNTNTTETEIHDALATMLHELIPNEAPVWKTWRELFLSHVVPDCPGVLHKPADASPLLNTLVQDANIALEFYRRTRGETVPVSPTLRTSSLAIPEKSPDDSVV